MNLFELQKFCSGDEDKKNIATPFSVREFSYATCGKIIVRVPRLENVPERDDAPQVEGPHIGDLFFQEPGCWYDLPIVNVAKEVCGQCSGVGKVLTCPECEGDGEVALSTDYNNYDKQECKSCRGSGVLSEAKWKNLMRQTSRNPDATCEICGGSGSIFPGVPVQIGEAVFSDYLLANLAGLPGPVQIGPFEPLTAARFRFSGGEGLIMPRRSSNS